METMVIWMVLEGKSEVYYRVRWNDSKFIPEIYSESWGEWKPYQWDMSAPFWDGEFDTLVVEIAR